MSVEDDAEAAVARVTDAGVDARVVRVRAEQLRLDAAAGEIVAHEVDDLALAVNRALASDLDEVRGEFEQVVFVLEHLVVQIGPCRWHGFVETETLLHLGDGIRRRLRSEHHRRGVAGNQARQYERNGDDDEQDGNDLKYALQYGLEHLRITFPVREYGLWCGLCPWHCGKVVVPGTGGVHSRPPRLAKTGAADERKRGRLGLLPNVDLGIDNLDFAVGAVRVTLDGGRHARLVGIEGPDAEAVSRSIPDNPASRTIGELGIGTNPLARLTGIILEDEKIYGSTHIAFGTNDDFGGITKAISHIDCVTLAPEVYLDDVLVAKDGRLLV